MKQKENYPLMVLSLLGIFVLAFIVMGRDRNGASRAFEGNIPISSVSENGVSFGSLDYSVIFVSLKRYATDDMALSQNLAGAVLSGKKDSQIGTASWIADKLFWIGAVDADSVFPIARWIMERIL